MHFNICDGVVFTCKVMGAFSVGLIKCDYEFLSPKISSQILGLLIQFFAEKDDEYICVQTVSHTHTDAA